MPAHAGAMVGLGGMKMLYIKPRLFCRALCHLMPSIICYCCIFPINHAQILILDWLEDRVHQSQNFVWQLSGKCMGYAGVESFIA
jgi:hypothetical protein